MEHKDWYRKLMHGLGKCFIAAKMNVVVTGLENIPKNGPVVIAPKHLHPYLDDILFPTILTRKCFYMGVILSAQSDIIIKINRLHYKQYGVFSFEKNFYKKDDNPRNMLSAYKNIMAALELGQAAVIFPEGFASQMKGISDKPDADGMISLKPGILNIIDGVQKRAGVQIPIIPVGLRYEQIGNQRNTAIVNFGEPIIIPRNNDAIDMTQTLKALEEQIRTLCKK